MQRGSISGFRAIVLVGALFLNGWLHGQQAEQPRPVVELTSYREVVKRVLPAVVSIETRAKDPGAAGNPLPEAFRRGPADNQPFGFGSGFFIDAAGVIVTNYHVIEGAESAVVQLHDGRKLSTKNIRGDRRSDLAVIVLDAKNERFPILVFGDSDAMEIGDRVLAVGAPFGLAGSVTQGIVSAKGRNGLRMNMYEDFLQTDAAINPGNSGGPLVNLHGEVVGINAAIKTKSGGFQGVGLATSSNLARQIVHALATTGTVRRGYLGAQINELSPEVADRFGLMKDGGAIIADLFDKTPAAKAGLVAGDIVLTVAGKPTRDGSALQRIVAMLPLGKAVAIELLRDGKPTKLTIAIEEQPADYGVDVGVPAPRNSRTLPKGVAMAMLGVDLADLMPELAEDLGYRRTQPGVVITRIHDASATAAGLKVGTVLTRIESQRVTSVATASKTLQGVEAGHDILVQIVTPQGGVNYAVVRR